MVQVAHTALVAQVLPEPEAVMPAAERVAYMPGQQEPEAVMALASEQVQLAQARRLCWPGRLRPHTSGRRPHLALSQSYNWDSTSWVVPVNGHNRNRRYRQLHRVYCSLGSGVCSVQMAVRVLAVAYTLAQVVVYTWAQADLQ